MTGNGSVFQLIGTGLSLTLQDSDPDAKHDGLPAGGVITGGNATDGGGVFVNGGSFTMGGGTIYNCCAEHGGGVYVAEGGRFTMEGGTIYNCRAEHGGGGVCVVDSLFTMSGGAIRDCSAMNGGGVLVSGGSFTMSGGICYDDISGNMDIKGKTVTFKNGDSKYALEVVADGKTVVAPTEPDAPEGKKFAGWYTDDALANEYDFDSPVTDDLTLYAGFEPAPGTPLGDVNGDGVVDRNDAVLLQKHLEGLEILTGKQLAVADFNGDGEVNYSDWTELQSYLESYLDLPVKDITVENGKATACGTVISKAALHTRVTLTADSPSDDMVFDKWIVNEGNVTLADASSATTTFTMPDSPVSVTATYKLSADEKVTLTVPFTTTVKLGGNVAPGKTSFELGLIDRLGNELTFDNQYIGTEITTNGAGDYDDELTITAPLSWLKEMLGKGAFIWQYDDEEAGWTYDDTVWGLDLYNEEIAARSVSEVPYSLLIFPTYIDDGSFALDLNAGTVERMTFTNTYTKTVTEPEEPDDPDDLGDPDKPTKPTKPTKPQTDDKSNPSTGDNSNLALCVALLAVSAAGLIGTGVYSKRGKNSRAK